MTTYHYSNTAVQTTLSSGINNVTTGITVGSVSGFPVSYPYSLTIDYGEPTAEVVTVSSGVGTSLTVIRGEDGTSAVSHLASAVVSHTLVARDAQLPQDHIAASTDVHGLGASAALVGTTTTQALTNKTIGNTNTVTLADTNFTVQDDGDPTKQVRLQVSGVTTATTRTLTVPDASGTLMVVDAAQSPTNKTFDNSNIVTLRDDRLTLQDSGDTSKQAAFQLSGITTATTRTYTLPNASSTLVDLVTAQTLDAKTLTAAPSVTTTGDVTVGGSLLSGLTNAWVSHTPTWTSDGTPPAIGNGTLEGRYATTNKLVVYAGRLVAGTTTTFGTGIYNMSLPVEASANSAMFIGAAYVIDASNSANQQSAIVRMDGTTLVRFAAGSGGSVAATVPFTLAQSDQIIWTIVYEAA